MNTATQKSMELPGLEEHPNADVVIFDGNCNFCRGQVERLARWDRGGRLAFVSLHDPLVAQRYPDLTHDQLMEQMYLVDQSGQRYGGGGLPVLEPQIAETMAAGSADASTVHASSLAMVLPPSCQTPL